MPYLTQDALEKMGFAALGRNVKISDRASIYEPERMTLGEHCRIDDFCVISGRVEMGRNVYIGPGSLVAGGEPGIVIEDFATLAYHAQVFTQSDDYSGRTMTNSTVPAAYKEETFAAVRLGRHAIVGAGAIVTPGADLAIGTSIGAGAVVLCPTQAWSIYVGVPARRIRARSQDLLALEAAYLRDEA